MQVQEFLEIVWSQQPGGFGFLGWRKPTGWSFTAAPSDKAKKLRVNNLHDLYFTPNVFREERRQKHLVCSSRWLYADLDEVNPEGLRWTPTLYWETSHGKYQGLWLMRKRLSPEWHAIVNQKLTYLTDADRGGWGASKVLRVPGSISTKHGGEYHILPAEYDEDLVYDVRELWQVLRDIPTAVVQSGKINFEETAKAKELIQQVPPKTRALLRRRKAADRSDHVYLTVAELAESGVFTPSEVMTLMLTSPVAQEKYGARIREELERVISKQSFVEEKPLPAEKPTDRKTKVNGVKRIETKSLYKFMGQDFQPPEWLVKGIWAKGAKGFIAGDPKTYKSTAAIDLAISVATGKPFLGHFPVVSRGPVLYVDEENQSGLTQARFSQILQFKGLQKQGYIPDQRIKRVHIASKEGFRLTNDDSITWIKKYVAENEIKLVILDPLYYVAQGVPENGEEMIDLLVDLDTLAAQMGVALIIIHHFKKQSRDNPADADDFQRMSGTGAFGRWFESILMMSRNGEEGVKVHTEHRMSKGFGFDLDFEMAGITDQRYRPRVHVQADEEMRSKKVIKDMVERDPRGVTVAQCCEAVGVDNAKTMTRHLRKWGYEIVTHGRGISATVRRSSRR